MSHWLWDVSDHDAHLLGDQGPWVHHLAAAWRACAGLSIGPLPAVVKATGHLSREAESHEELVAFWAPLFQLAFFGLGWTRVDLGLSRWLDAGRPTDEPVLAVIDRWWGTEVEDVVLKWAAQTQTVRDLGQRLVNEGPYLRFDRSPFRADEWDGEHDGDPMHVGYHVWTPVASGVDIVPKGGPPLDSVTSHRLSGDRAVIIADTYSGWYSELWRLGADRTDDGRSVRTDVFVKPIGWIGEYRRSTVTGGYFRGRHRYHVMGA